MLDDSRRTPAHEFNDGQNYHPTNKWVLFGHHFAAISGAGPLIGPVLAIQYGYMPGLLWLVIGVCLAGAVQDMLVLAASRAPRRQVAGRDRAAPSWAGQRRSSSRSRSCSSSSSRWPGLGFVVVKALGGEEVKLPAGMEIRVTAGASSRNEHRRNGTQYDVSRRRAKFAIRKRMLGLFDPKASRSSTSPIRRKRIRIRRK